jgi:hypothetical protein
MIKHLLKGVLPVAAIALGLATASCGNLNFSVGDDDGVPLSELDMSGDVPTKLVLAGPDKVVVTEGEKLAITVSGDQEAIDGLRFNLEDGTLGIMRRKDWKAQGVATVSVTMPPMREIVLAGSGDITAPALVEEAEVNIAGSGTVAVDQVRSTTLDVNVMGSGTLSAAGTADRLDLNVAGSGVLDGRALKVDQAQINIAGSGGGEFASDGKVEARIAGSGNVTVYGRADCSVKAMGSGTVRCRPAEATQATSGGAPKAPNPPAAPGAPSAPEAPRPAE